MSRGTCKICGCTDSDCRQCIEKDGMPCYWVDPGHEMCSSCHVDLLLVNENEITHYVGILEMTYQAKNKLQKSVLEYFESIDRTLIEKSDLEKLKATIDEKIKEINTSNPRCYPLKIYFESDDLYGNKRDVIIRDAHVVHFVIRACETKDIF